MKGTGTRLWIRRLAGAGLWLCATGVWSQEAAETMSFPSSASAITVDVIVLDQDRRPVRGLTRGDFTVSEDGRPQALVAFEERALLTSPATPPVAATRVATNEEAAGQTGRVIAFVIDDLGLDPIRGGADVQKAVARWLKEKADPRDDVTIATTSGDVWWTALVGRGQSDLLAVLARARGKKSPHEVREHISDWEASEIVSGGGLGGASSFTGASSSSRGMDGAGAAAGAATAGPADSGPTELGGVLGRVVNRWRRPGGRCDGITSTMCTLLVQRRSEEVHDRTVRRRQALVRLVDRLSLALLDRHGRKSIVLFSEGFIELPQVGPDEKALDATRRANVAVYFVDARGQVAPSFYSAENSAAPVQEDIGLMTLDLGVLSVAGGESLAQATGGFAVQSNDLFDGVTRAADESSAYYLLGYQPEVEPDGKWHGLKVAVNRPGVKVRARQGYYATRGLASAVSGSSRGAAQSSEPLLDPALLAGGDRDAIPLRLVCRPLGEGPNGQRILVGLDIGTANLAVEQGVALDITLLSVSREMPILTPERQRVTLRGGETGAPWWPYVKEIVLPAGPAQIKALVRETSSGRVGTVTQTLDVPASMPTPPREFESQSAVLLFAPREGKREATLLVRGAPASVAASLSPEAGAASQPHRVLVARLEDASGRTVEQLTHAWPGGTLGQRPFRGYWTLAPGEYTLESSILDLASGAVSVERRAVRVPEVQGVALSSVVALAGGTTVADGVATPADPLRVGPAAFVPRLDTRLTQGTAELPVLFRVYPVGESPVLLSLEIQREGTRLLEQKASPPAPDAGGGLAWLGSLPTAALPVGRYALVIRARQGEANTEESLLFEIVARAAAKTPAAEAVVPPPTQAPQDDEQAEFGETLRQAGQYVTAYAQAFQDLVAEEVYEQTQELDRFGPTRRRTRADIVFVALEGAFPWGVFRDVFEVDGHALRDRESRLEKLFVQKGASALSQARELRAESARYNLGVARTVNEPTLPLAFLLPANQGRFRFWNRGHKRVGEVESLEVAFEEAARPTLISDERGGDLPVEGRFWIELAKGTVLKTTVVLKERGQMTVEYQPETNLSIRVPSVMSESFRGVKGRARYSGYRRFGVETTETLRGPK